MSPLVRLQVFCLWLVATVAGPRNEHSKARPPGPTETYIDRYVAGSG